MREKNHGKYVILPKNLSTNGYLEIVL